MIRPSRAKSAAGAGARNFPAKKLPGPLVPNAEPRFVVTPSKYGEAGQYDFRDERGSNVHVVVGGLTVADMREAVAAFQAALDHATEDR